MPKPAADGRHEGDHGYRRHQRHHNAVKQEKLPDLSYKPHQGHTDGVQDNSRQHHPPGPKPVPEMAADRSEDGAAQVVQRDGPSDGAHTPAEVPFGVVQRLHHNSGDHENGAAESLDHRQHGHDYPAIVDSPGQSGGAYFENGPAKNCQWLRLFSR